MDIKYLFNFPTIKNLDDLANKIQLSKYLIYHLTYNTKYFYKKVEKKKSQGGYRQLFCPSNKLKAVQAWILRKILEYIPLEENATAFRKGMNVRDNVEKHKENKFILCLDIKNFFDNIPKKWVYNFYLKLGYNKHVSILLTNICTLEGHLPQGAVTSPSLSNILLKRLDRRISGYAGKRNITYTRYADDIALSSNDPAILENSKQFIINKIINDEGFKLNKAKTRMLRPGNRREITGLVITDNDEVRIGRKTKKKIRAAIHHYIYGKKDVWQDHEELKQHIKGWMNFIKGVDEKSYKQLDKYRKKLKQKKITEEAAATSEK
ncbi:MAG: retron St85 family RNA-directed DNA polymerase [archaeon]